MKWQDGSSYSGQWYKGIQHGIGRALYPDGTVKAGLFKNNVFVGDTAPVTNENLPQRTLDHSTAVASPISSFSQAPNAPNRLKSGRRVDRAPLPLAPKSSEKVPFSQIGGNIRQPSRGSTIKVNSKTKSIGATL
jgi:hypothetical protein